MAYIEGDFPINVGGNNNGGMWGQDGIWAILLLALLGNRGFGFGGGTGAVGGDLFGYQLGKLASTNDVASGFSTSEIMSDLNSILLSNAQGFAGINSAIANSTSTLGYNMLQGFNGVDKSVCTLGYNIQSGFNSLSNQVASCCCDVKGILLENRYLNEKQTCDIINAFNTGNQRIIDYLTTEKINALTAENVALKGRISNDAQSAYIINALAPACPKPAYIVPNPNCCYSGFVNANTIVQ